MQPNETRRKAARNQPAYGVGAKVVCLAEVRGPNGLVLHPRGGVGVVVKRLEDADQTLRVQFFDGVEVHRPENEWVLLDRWQEHESKAVAPTTSIASLRSRLIFRCVIGSQAYGLARDDSDVDRRGVYLPTADMHWSLFGVPEQFEDQATQEAYWELEKFLLLALKSNPNVLECLWSPIVEEATPLGRELLEMRKCFLSKLVYQTYNGYAMSQFHKMQNDLLKGGAVKWKHVMHLLRLLIAGAEVLRTGEVVVDVGQHREFLLAVRDQEVPWADIDQIRRALHADFLKAYSETTLPERPDYARADAFLIRCRRFSV